MTLHRRLRLLLIAAASSAVALPAIPLHAATPAPASVSSAEEQAVLAPIQAMFDGMASRDPAAMRQPLLPGGTMVLMRDGNPTQITFDAFADRIARPAPNHIPTHIQERIHHPLIRVDNDLAMVWAPFDFLVDGKVDHCGTDLFNLVRKDGRWLIASVADTGRKLCPAH